MEKLKQWFNQKKKEVLTAGAVTILLAVTVGPTIAAGLRSMVTDLLTAAIALVVLMGVVILAPMVFYWLSLLAYRGRVRAIENNEVAALAGELQAIRKVVEDSEGRLGRCDNRIAQIKEVLRIKGRILAPEDVRQLEDVTDGLEADRTVFKEVLEEDRADLAEMEREMVRSEIKDEVLQLFSEAADELKPGERRGLQSDTARIALRSLAGKAAEKRTIMQARLQARLADRQRTRMPEALPSGQSFRALLPPDQADKTKEAVLIERPPKKG